MSGAVSSVASILPHRMLDKDDARLVRLVGGVKIFLLV